MDKEELMDILSNWKKEMMDEFSRRINILGESIGVMMEERLSRVESKICYIERETKAKNILIHRGEGNKLV